METMVARVRPTASADLANLDLLRTLAVALVFVDHASHMVGLRGLGGIGHLGVLLFFVHTSLVLMMSMERLGSGGGLYRSFLIRRIFRIFPLSMVMVLSVALFHIPRVPWEKLGFHAPNTLEFLSNLFLVQNVTQVRSILSVLWSLPFEFQMYLVLPLLFLLLRNREKQVALFTVWAGSIIAASAEFYLRDPGTDLRLDTLLLRYVPCFLAGVAAWTWLGRTKRLRLPAWGWVVFLVLLVVLNRCNELIRVYGFHFGGALHGHFAKEGQLSWPPIMELVSDWLFCALAGAAIPQFAEVTNKFLKSFGKFVAKYSYGIYVCHLPMLWLCCTKLLPRLPRLGAGLAVLLTGLLSIALYHLVEEPAIRLGKQLAARPDARAQSKASAVSA